MLRVSEYVKCYSVQETHRKRTFLLVLKCTVDSFQISVLKIRLIAQAHGVCTQLLLLITSCDLTKCRYIKAFIKVKHTSIKTNFPVFIVS